MLEKLNKPLISIIIPVYNVEKYLERCIQSCLNQTFPNLEIVLINDGSTDSSGDLCEKIAKTDRRIKVIHKENGGLSSARNIGIQNVTGEYICFLDSDDWMNVNTIEVSLQLSIALSADIVFWSRVKEFINKSVKYKAYQSNKEYEVFEGEELDNLKRRSVGLINTEIANPTKTDSFISAWGKLYKTKLIRDNNITFLPTQLVGSEDVPFNVEAFYYSSKVVFLNQYYNHYRMYNENSLTKNHKNTLFIRYKNLYNYILDFLKSKNVSEEYFEALNNRLALTLINNCLSISNTRYDVSIFTKFNDIKKIINDEEYYKSLENLKIKYLPFLWKLFFILALRKQHRSLLLITIIYRIIKK